MTSGKEPDVAQRVAFVAGAKSPIEKLKAFKAERGWRNLPGLVGR